MKKIKERLKSIFGRSDKSKKPNTGTDKEKDDLSDDSLYDFKIIVKKNMPSELLSEVLGLNENINKQGRILTRQGKRDGAMGVQSMKPVKLRIRAIVSSIINPLKSSAGGITRGLKSLLDGQQKDQKAAEGEHKRKSDFSNWLNQEYYNNPKNFSRNMGWFYLLVSGLLILADIPLALELTSKGLELSVGSEQERYGLPYLFTPDFLAVLSNNWEVFLMASGISLCTVYIKIYYDEFVGKPLDKQVLYIKKISENQNLEAEDVERMEKNQKKRSRIKLVVLLFSFVTIVVLGLFRYRTLLITPSEDSNSDIYALPGGALVALVFICLTVLFPLIGGICASLGISNIQNYKLLKRAEKARDDAKVRLDDIAGKVESSIVKYNTWESYLFRFLTVEDRKAWPDRYERNNNIQELSEAEAEIRDYLVACYVQGYNEGILTPKSMVGQEGLFEMAAELRNRQLTQNSNRQLRTEEGANMELLLDNE